MNIIPNITNYLNTQLNSFFTNFVTSPKSLQLLEYKLPNLIQSLSLQSLAMVLESIDDTFVSSIERKCNYTIKDKKERTINTVSGSLTFSRRYYLHRTTNTYYFYLDDFLELLPYKRCTPYVETSILENLAKDTATTYRQAAAPFGMSKGFVYNLLKRLDITTDTPDLKQKVKCKQLYVQADEEHIHLQFKKGGRMKSNGKKKSTNYELKEVTIFTGKEKIGKKRYRLLNKVIITPFFNESNDDFNKRVDDYIQRNFEYENKLYCYGDGASWIKSLAEDIASYYILDKFHFAQSLTRATGGSKFPEVVGLLNQYARGGEKEEFEYLINMHMGVEARTKNYNIKARNYLLNNWNAYQLNYTLDNQSGCSAEGINSHYFSSYYSSRPKGFCIQNIHTIGVIRALYYSGFNVVNYYQENRRRINTEVNEYYNSKKYQKKTKKVTLLDINQSIPATLGRPSGTRETLKKIIH